MEIRFGSKKDLEELRLLLFEAFFWNSNTVRPNIDEFFRDPEINKLIKDWDRPGDQIVIAEENKQIFGSAWYRLWTEANHSYGYVSSDIPEIGIAIFPAFRSRGIGRTILKKLIETARKDKFKALSLSVSPENYARNLYESLGFKKVGESGTSWTYKLDL